MPREIKFREWAPCKKVLYGPVTVGDRSWGTTRDTECFDENCEHVLQQFTGLKDCFGKEIFEGDIVTNRSMFGEDLVTAVKWCDKYTGFFPFIFAEGDEWEPGTCRVIGNIYQHPELLKNAKTT